MEATKAIPVHILTGFLGSGKTTLLTRLLDHYKLQGQRPAVLMNELGDVNLDGMLVEGEVPMAEMLGGCICCTVRADLGMELKELAEAHRPDVILVECTGAANPLEIIDGVTDASLLTPLALHSVITVVDAAHFAGQESKGQSRTFRLMRDQIRCATRIVLNKSDLVEPSQLEPLIAALREINAAAPIYPAVRCGVELTLLEAPETGATGVIGAAANACGCGEDAASGQAPREQEAPGQGRDAEGGDPVAGRGQATHDAERATATPGRKLLPAGQGAGHTAHATHHHVMAYTHYFRGPIDSERFEALVGALPPDIYRAKGILRFTDTASTFLFQYAYREADFMKITPQADVPTVAVFIGEHFDQTALAATLAELETVREAT